ncbi:MAG: hypothetical protein IPM48_12090 [Saprospiraceae bacterium]|nr:hypothetical protein [Saprospiraceae bacterium]
MPIKILYTKLQTLVPEDFLYNPAYSYEKLGKWNRSGLKAEYGWDFNPLFLMEA